MGCTHAPKCVKLTRSQDDTRRKIRGETKNNSLIQYLITCVVNCNSLFVRLSCFCPCTVNKGVFIIIAKRGRSRNYKQKIINKNLMLMNQLQKLTTNLSNFSVTKATPVEQKQQTD